MVHGDVIIVMVVVSGVRMYEQGYFHRPPLSTQIHYTVLRKCNPILKKRWLIPLPLILDFSLVNEQILLLSKFYN